MLGSGRRPSPSPPRGGKHGRWRAAAGRYHALRRRRRPAAGPRPPASPPAEDPWRLHLPRHLAGAPDDLLLKVTPPRVPRHQVARPRLQADDERLRDQPVILVQAPAGFGKTSLLAQWRREHLAQGRWWRG